MLTSKRIASLLLLMFCFSSIFAGGGWTEEKGKGYFKLSEQWIISDQYSNDKGELQDAVFTSGLFNTNLYGEYGITNKFTAILSAPVFSRAFNTAVDSLNIKADAINTIGDIDLGLKYSIYNGSVAVAISAFVGIPTGEDEGGELKALQTGDGEFNQAVRVDVGTGFGGGKINGYANIYAGFNNRTQGFSDEILYGLEVGAGFLNKKLWASLKLDGIEPLNNDDENTPIRPGLFSNRRAYSGINIDVAYYITEKLGVSAGIGIAATVRNMYADPSFNVGVFLDL